MGIRAVVFDCGGVLLRDGDLSAYGQWEARLGLERGALAARLWQSETWLQAERGQLSDADFWAEVGCSLGLCATEAAQLREDLWDTWVVDEAVLALVDQTRATHRVAMLSNASDALEDLLEQRYHVRDRFDPLVTSARVGLVKPDPGIYQEILRRLALSASEVLFVDDRAENIAAAAALGLHVAWFVGAAELARQLRLYLNGQQGQARRQPPLDGQAAT